MKKILEIDNETEQTLIRIFDSALKREGIMMLDMVQNILKKVKNVISNPQEEKKE